MFLDFFYFLREHGFKVSLNEWLTVLEGLQEGLHQSSLSGFYTLCRAALVKSETDFDQFDQLFMAFFENCHVEEVPEAFYEWLNKPWLSDNDTRELAQATGLSREEIEELFAKRLKDQHEEHDGGHKWIGTGGYTAYGHHGRKLGGIRVGGKSQNRSAYRVVGERHYRDWRSDQTLDSRQFQMAFRSLRQLSGQSEIPKTELDVDNTIQETCNQAGRLQIVYRRPRKNTVKVLLLMDSGGSMEGYSRLCSLLFQSITKAGYFQDLKVYYFHNFIEPRLYLEPTLNWRKMISLDWILQNLNSEYRVIIVGDGEMAPEELMTDTPWLDSSQNNQTGLDRLKRLKRQYPHLVWFHPQPQPKTESYWTQTFTVLQKNVEMYQLTLDGLAQGMKKLMVNR